MKQTHQTTANAGYEAIEMPRNSPAGFIIAFFAVIMGFSLIWHIWWLAILGFLAAAIAVLMAAWSTTASTKSRPLTSRKWNGRAEARGEPHDHNNNERSLDRGPANSRARAAAGRLESASSSLTGFGSSSSATW